MSLEFNLNPRKSGVKPICRGSSEFFTYKLDVTHHFSLHPFFSYGLRGTWSHILILNANELIETCVNERARSGCMVWSWESRANLFVKTI